MSAVATKQLQMLIEAAINAQAPATDIVPIVPDDDDDLPWPARSIRCAGDGGALRVTTAAGQVRDTTIAAGTILPLQVTRVHATGTEATGLEALP